MNLKFRFQKNSITNAPEQNYFEDLVKIGFSLPQIVFTPPISATIDAWGASPSVITWAKMHGFSYESPPWQIVKEVNSKDFSFLNSPKLPGSTLIRNWIELSEWATNVNGSKVLKSCLGVSGRGHFHLKTLEDPSLKAFLEREWGMGLPLIAEPWVQRKCDFSTQWKISKDGIIEYIGFTICDNDARGHYRGTIVGNPEQLLGDFFHFLEIHSQEARRILLLMHQRGFFGQVGFDAMIYADNLLQPIVEINARKTMGWVALAIQQRLFPQSTLKISLRDRKEAQNSLLPSRIITSKHHEITFQKQLCVEIVDL